MTFVGEIGYPRREYLYDLRYIDLIQISRGYNRRHRQEWSIARWQTYNTMLAMAGSKALREAGINAPTDLLAFPWEKDPAPPITEEDQQELLDLMASINAQNAASTSNKNGKG